MSYSNHKRTSSKATIEVTRYTLDGLPTCASWFGDEDYKREVCQFLLTKSFGTKFVCGLDGSDLQSYPEMSLIKPTRTCLLWEHNTN